MTNTNEQQQWGKIVFKAVLQRAFDGGWIARCPSLPGCKGYGRTQEGALEGLQRSVKKALDPVVRISSELLQFTIEEDPYIQFPSERATG